MSAHPSLPGPDTELLRKKIVKLFKDSGLDITIDVNADEVNFLDVTFSLSNGRYKPYSKPNNEILYINKQSNHPPTILRQLPSMIEKRISDLSFSKEEFDNSKQKYESALSNSGHKTKLKFEKSAPKSRSRPRNITYFNPPFNAAVTTNVGKEFLNLIEKHFPKHNKYHKIFNRNTVKLSYSCSPSMKTIISSHNKSILNSKPEPSTPKRCNCRNPCPLPNDGDCRRSRVSYKATITSDDATPIKEYIGSTECDVKLRLANHRHSFRNNRLRNATRLSAYIHELQEKNQPWDIKWSIQAQSTPYVCGSRRCNLCITEKYEILQSDPTRTINKRTEIANRCQHCFKYKLCNV